MTIVTLKDPYFGEFYWHRTEIEEHGICCKCNDFMQKTLRRYTVQHGDTMKIMALCQDCEREHIVREREE